MTNRIAANTSAGMDQAAQDLTNAVLAEFTAAGKMFTSVDIGNEVKRRGTWVRNSHVAAHLRSVVQPATAFAYTATRIMVSSADDGQTYANLYHPAGADFSGYADTAQAAITPDEFNAKYKGVITTTSSPAVDPAAIAAPQAAIAAPTAPAAAPTAAQVADGIRRMGPLKLPPAAPR